MRYTLVYDGQCRMCARIVDVVRRWDARSEIELLPSQAEGVIARFPWIGARAFQESIQLVDEQQNSWQGAAAVEQLLTILPRGRWIAWIFRIPLARWFAERGYRWIARHRYRLGCGVHCRTVSS